MDIISHVSASGLQNRIILRYVRFSVISGILKVSKIVLY